jgi:acyl-CoA dehydrogenase-like protein
VVGLEVVPEYRLGDLAHRVLRWASSRRRRRDRRDHAAARQLTYTAAAKSEREEPDLTWFGAAAKCFASDAALEITTNAVQLLGGTATRATSRPSA